MVDVMLFVFFFPMFFLYITNITYINLLTKLTMLRLLQFILLTYNISFSKVDNTTHHRHNADTSTRF